MRLAVFLFAILTTAAQPAPEPERSVASWIIRMGGSVTPVGANEPIRDLSLLPSGDFRVAVADFTGTLLTPEELKRIRNLTELRELYLPAPMWNEGAGSRRDSNDKDHPAYR